jgi:hypothetical protein
VIQVHKVILVMQDLKVYKDLWVHKDQ